MTTITTPYEAARDLIYRYVERGDLLEDLAYGQMGAYIKEYDAQIGGYLRAEGNKEYKKLTAHQIGVSRVNGQSCFAVFSLDKLYNEIKAELSRQPRLEGF